MQTVDRLASVVSADVPRMTLLQAEARADAALLASKKWRETSWAERQRCLRGAVRLLRERAPKLALLMAREMGKPITQGQAECEKSAWACNY
ncbi:MAG TPA: aldehyde dehydrogenase family protein, partial [Polyangiaceae bacterium]|nr:aldehyde dehydrogenase family protein [Polyangiaceae bacterium]